MTVKRFIIFALMLCVFMSLAQREADSAELVQLGPDTWDEFIPRGKEVDCIYGDFVMRNDRIVVVIAEPLPTRNANMTVRNVGGGIIDLTQRYRQNDQLSAFYPEANRISLAPPQAIRGSFEAADGGAQFPITALRPLKEPVEGKRVELEIVAQIKNGAPTTTLRYSLADGDSHVTVETVYENETDAGVSIELSDSMRADRTFEFGADEKTNLFWAHDEWFRQAYGIVGDDVDVRRASGGGVRVEYQKDGTSKLTVAPGKSFTLGRKIFPGANLLDVKGIAGQLYSDDEVASINIDVTDPNGPIRDAKVTLQKGDAAYGNARTAKDGKLAFVLPSGEYRATIEALGRDTVEVTIDTAKSQKYVVSMQRCGYVAAEITDADGGPIPCKVEFRGKDGTKDPYFGPDSRAVTTHNLRYSHNGKFRQELGPGKYDVIISRGPEYDAVFTEIEIARDKETQLAAQLIRTVDTPGWISSDFHSHSSPSGDNTSSQRGRVLNLLCEHIEFAPCTEHNRLSSYTPHLKKLGVEHLMATCVGMELTGSPGSVNHQNAFPLLLKPRTQDGGAPVTDSNPVVQIERLALWDDNSDKLVQSNHPTIEQIIGDRDLDGKFDGGFEKMFGFMDVIEVHPPHMIFTPPKAEPGGRPPRNAIFRWMQTLNIGYRVPGVVNTDAHYLFHGSGWLRNWLKSSTDDPAKIETMDMVHTSEAGHVIMSNGPYLEVTLTAAGGDKPAKAIAGDDLSAPDGKAELHVRVQCANWLDINRVQVFLNGRQAEELNFTRRTTPEKFSDEVVKFDAVIPLELKTDTHVIVAAAGEGLQLGPVMGSDQGKDMPIAVSNPIFVDFDGDGFKPNGDLLDVPLPLPSATSNGDN